MNSGGSAGDAMDRRQTGHGGIHTCTITCFEPARDTDRMGFGKGLLGMRVHLDSIPTERI